VVFFNDQDRLRELHAISNPELRSSEDDPDGIRADERREIERLERLQVDQRPDHGTWAFEKYVPEVAP